jgi:aryl-alcohol dehydrogenase-like predicted oxidoreductase
MEYRQLGRTGLHVSALALGTGNFGDMTSEETARRILETAIEAGINLLDTADGYCGGESERIIGRFLQDTGQRDRVLIATKVFYPTGPGPNDRGLSRHHVLRACEASLRRLGTDHVDLYLLHRSASLVTPIEETLEALTDLLRQGKVSYVGCSTFPAWQVMEALMVSAQRGFVRFVVESPPYNLLDRRAENERIPLCQKYGLGVLPWSPLAMGMLPGRWLVSRGVARGPEPAGDLRPARQPARGACRRGPRRAGRSARPQPRAARAPLGQGPARGHGADRRPPHHGPARRDAGRRGALGR